MVAGMGVGKDCWGLEIILEAIAQASPRLGHAVTPSENAGPKLCTCT